MKHNRPLLMRLGILAGAVVIALSAVVYSRLLGGGPRFDADFYAAGKADKQKPFSYDAYAAALKKYVDKAGMVNYAELKKDRRQLDAFVRAVGRLDPKAYRKWDDSAKIAFLVNAYNALTLKAIVDRYPIKPSLLRSVAYPKNSIRQIAGVWDKLQFLVMGEKMTLDGIEHTVLRARYNQSRAHRFAPKERFDEPRIHMALVCAAMGCPPLRNEPYLGEKLGEQLDDQTRKFSSDLAKFRIDRAAGKVYLSAIFKWFGQDFVTKHKPEKGFAGHQDAVRASLNFTAGRLSKDDAAWLAGKQYRVAYLDYDWSLNEQKKTDKPARR